MLARAARAASATIAKRASGSIAFAARKAAAPSLAASFQAREKSSLTSLLKVSCSHFCARDVHELMVSVCAFA